MEERAGARLPAVLAGPQPFSRDDLLSHIDPAPDEETERLVAAIYADRHAAEGSSRE
ncbi:MAG TPA: hypothetical protein VKT49_13890 [Bryobacteraceae bacterium]|nr:hypothetical protein [Bryobacteraceae bacterium]